MPAKPQHGPFARLGKVVGARPLQLRVVETGERPREQLGRGLELVGDLAGCLRGIARQIRPLVAVHPRKTRTLLDKREVHALALDEKDVPDMTGVLEGRPDARTGSSADRLCKRRVGALVGQPHGEAATQRPDRSWHGAGIESVIGEVAFVAALHLHIVADPQPGRGSTDREEVASRSVSTDPAVNGHEVIGGTAVGFMDKVKAQATSLAEKAQEGAKAGQAKISDMQSKKHADALLLELGGIVYTQQAGRAAPDADAKASELVEQLRQFEAEHGQVAVTSATLIAPAAPDGAFVPTATGAGDTPAQPSTPAPTVVTGGGGMPVSTGGIPQSTGGIPQSTGGIPQSTGGIPTGSYSSDGAETAETQENSETSESS